MTDILKQRIKKRIKELKPQYDSAYEQTFWSEAYEIKRVIDELESLLEK